MHPSEKKQEIKTLKSSSQSHIIEVASIDIPNDENLYAINLTYYANETKGLFKRISDAFKIIFKKDRFYKETLLDKKDLQNLIINLQDIQK